MHYKLSTSQNSRPHSEHNLKERAIEEQHKEYLRGKRWNLYEWNDRVRLWVKI